MRKECERGRVKITLRVKKYAIKLCAIWIRIDKRGRRKNIYADADAMHKQLCRTLPIEWLNQNGTISLRHTWFQCRIQCGHWTLSRNRNGLVNKRTEATNCYQFLNNFISSTFLVTIFRFLNSIDWIFQTKNFDYAVAKIDFHLYCSWSWRALDSFQLFAFQWLFKLEFHFNLYDSVAII